VICPEAARTVLAGLALQTASVAEKTATPFSMVSAPTE